MLLVSYIMLFILMLVVRVRESKEDFCEKIIDTFLGLIIYNGMISIVYSLFNIDITSVNLIIANLILSCILLIIVLKKGMQSFKVNPYYIVTNMIVILIGYIIFNMLYQGGSRISFDTTDPATHMNFIRQFLENSQLVLTKNTSIPYPGNGGPFLHYINNGIVCLIFNQIDIYKTYLVGNVILLVLTGMKSIYIMGKIIQTKNIAEILVSFILGLTLMLGFPLNALIFGFSSQIIVFPIIVLLIDWLQLKEYDRLNFMEKIWLNIILIGIFFAYHYYIPEIFVAVGIYILISNFKKTDLSFIKRSILTIRQGLEAFLIPIIFGIIFLWAFNAPNTKVIGDSVNLLALEGYIWRDLFNTMYALVPIVIFIALNHIKNKKNDFTTLLMSIAVLFSSFILILGLRGQASSYYFYKNHYVLMIFALCMLAQIIPIIRNNKVVKYTLYCTALLLSCFTLYGEGYIHSKNLLFDPVPLSNNNIYAFNLARLRQPTVIYNKEELELIQEVNNNKDIYTVGGRIEVVGDMLQLRWFRELTGIWPKYNGDEQLAALDNENRVNLEEFLNQKEHRYLILFSRHTKEWVEQNIDFNKYEIIKEIGENYILRYKDN